mmetsp:Transcript_15449/g.18626  ORF Transcript_15449/g.18626 Transcript_15449/m.18626 type:complete len:102 (-) Transcript_15449:499-804(-)
MPLRMLTSCTTCQHFFAHHSEVSKTLPHLTSSPVSHNYHRSFHISPVYDYALQNNLFVLAAIFSTTKDTYKNDQVLLTKGYEVTPPASLLMMLIMNLRPTT